MLPFSTLYYIAPLLEHQLPHALSTHLSVHVVFICCNLLNGRSDNKVHFDFDTDFFLHNVEYVLEMYLISVHL